MKDHNSNAKKIKNIVLVHGAFTDGSCWAKVIPLLQAKGYNTVAVQNPMTSLAEEVSATKRMIALQDGPVILVGHSWGGVVITQAGEDPKVAGLVYVTGYAPEVGQSANDSAAPYGWSEGQKQIRVDSEKYAYVTQEGMFENIAEGLPMEERALALAVQGQSYGPMFDEKVTATAWKARPTWALISTKDRMLQPAMELAMAKRMNAKTTTVESCHMVILEAPGVVANIIDEACDASTHQIADHNVPDFALFAHETRQEETTNDNTTT